MYTQRQRRANNALGITVICAITGMETAFAHHKNPSPASPYIWLLLGSVAIVSLVYYLRNKGGGTDGVRGSK